VPIGGIMNALAAARQVHRRSMNRRRTEMTAQRLARIRKPALAFVVFLFQTVQPSGSAAAETFEDVYGWVYRTGKEVDVNVPAATCLGLKTPQTIFERTWIGTDAKVHAIADAKDSSIVLLSVMHDLSSPYSGSFWLSTKDGRLLGVCNSPFLNAAYVAVKDGSLDAKFESEKTYFITRFGDRVRWDRLVTPKRAYP
jgi:hypothetical protein